MEVILLEDVPGIGKKNDLIVVGDGFALNNLLPHRKALVATPTVRKRYAEHIRRRALERLREQELMAKATKALAGLSVTFERKVTKTGKLYASITQKHIAEALKEQHQVEVPEDVLHLEGPIKALGEFTVKVQIGDTVGEIKVIVKEAKE